MSFLTPLYILGALAIVGPIVFHLIRRSPRGEVPFGSLMFLSATPPRLTRRSRLDDLLLLVLRAAALGLLAFAFARPFLREVARLDAADAEERRIAVLIDTSASMQRGDLWNRAKALAAETIGESRPGDRLAVLAFDTSSRPVLGFAESATLDPARRQAVAKAKVEQLAPSWGATDLGQALIDAVAALEDVADTSRQDARMPRRIVLISDLQQGSRLDALGLFEWPSDVEVELKTVTDERPNAGIERLADSEGDASSRPQLRVRVASEARSMKENLELVWKDSKGAAIGRPQTVYVPAGQSRVASTRKPENAVRLRLEGDAHAFDNTLFVASEPSDAATVVYVGHDKPDDPAGLLYYVERLFEESIRRDVEVAQANPDETLTLDLEAMPLVIVASQTPALNVERLVQYARSGGTVLCVLRSPDDAATFAALADIPISDVEEAKVAGDVMLAEVDFSHPLFAPLAGAQYNDFTKIHFWKYRRIDAASFDEARVIARFETGDPAIVEKFIGKGRVVAFASGWNPADSQLARSSKFVPVMAGLLERRNAPVFDAANLVVNDTVPLSAVGTTGEQIVVRKPDGTSKPLASRDGAFTGTDQPGVYTAETAEGVKSFAVNLDPAESRTTPLEVEALEQLGCRLASGATPAEAAEQRRQLLNAELEGRQKLWRWFVLAAIGVLIVETWVAGRPPRLRSTGEEALAT